MAIWPFLAVGAISLISGLILVMWLDLQSRRAPEEELWFVEFLPESEALASAPPPEGRPEDGRPSCLVCCGPLEEDVIYCRRCGTPHHRECFRYAGACTVFACGSRRYLKKAPQDREYTLTIS
jgi:hypothetical protein